MQARDKLMELLENEVAAITSLQAEMRTAKARIAGFEATLPAFDDPAAKRKIEDKIRKEQQALAELEAKVADAKGKISAFDEAIKLLPKDASQSRDLRAGSELALVGLLFTMS